MQLTKENIGELRERLVAVRERGKEYFAEADPEKAVETAPPFCESWEIKDAQTLQESAALRQAIKDLSVDIAAAAQLSPLLADADMQELRHNTRQMLANVHFSEYRHTGVYVHHDEGTVLGVDPPTHEEILLGDALTAPRRFDQAAAKTLDLLGLLLPSDAPVKEVGGLHVKDVQPLHQLLQVPLAKLQRWSLPGIRVWWKIAAATVIPLAALASLLVDSQAIKGWFTTDSRPVATSGGDRTSPVQVAPSPNKDADEAAAPERVQTGRIEIRIIDPEGAKLAELASQIRKDVESMAKPGEKWRVSDGPRISVTMYNPKIPTSGRGQEINASNRHDLNSVMESLRSYWADRARKDEEYEKRLLKK